MSIEKIVEGLGIDLPEELLEQLTEQVEQKKNFDKANKWISDFGIQRSIKMFANNTNMNRPKGKLRYEVAVGGGSYTDGELVRLALNDDWVNRDENDWARFMKFVAAHELGHINWSDFKIFVDFQKRAESYFQKKHDVEGAGKIAGNMLNITEDGRIERGQANLMPGLRKYIRYVNGVNYEGFPSNNLGIVPLHDFINTSLMLSKVGLLPKGYDQRIEGTETDVAVKKAMPHIVDAIRSTTAKGCADATWEILVENGEFIANAMKKFQADQDELEEMLNEDMSDDSTDGEGGQGDSSDSSQTSSSEQGEESSESSDKKDGEGSTSESKEEEGKEGEESGDSSSQESKGKGKKITIDPLDDVDGEADYTNQPSMGDIEEGNESTHFSDEDETAEGKANSKSLSKAEEKSDSDEDSDNLSTLDKLVVETESEAMDFLDKAKDIARRENDRIQREEAERKKTDITDKEVNGVLSKYAGPMSFKYVTEVTDDNGPISESVMTAGRGLRRDLKEIFNDKRGWTLHNQRSGMLDESQLYRAGSQIQDTDVFIKRQLPEDSSWAVSVLVDNSGSMRGSVYDESGNHIGHKTKVAREATSMLEIALSGLVPVKISRFDVSWSGNGKHIVQHAQVRGWEQKNKEILSWNSTDQAGCGNADAMSIGVAVEELKNRRENKKMLIVLSDGLPAENTPQQVKKVIEESRKDGVKIIGIGFGSEAELKRSAPVYREMYDRDIVLTMPDGLKDELVKVLRSTIARG